MDFLDEMIERREQTSHGFREYVDKLAKEKGITPMEKLDTIHFHELSQHIPPGIFGTGCEDDRKTHAHYSTLIEGYNTNHNTSLTGTSKDELAFQGCHNAAKEILKLSYKWWEQEPVEIFKPNTILKIHNIAYAENPQQAGQFRSHNVQVGNHVCPDWEQIPKLVAELCHKTKTAIHRGMPYQQVAANVHLYMALIHPFADGNGRTARLFELLFLLIGQQYPIDGLETRNPFEQAKYNWETRPEYYRLLSAANTAEGDKAFINYCLPEPIDFDNWNRPKRKKVRTFKISELPTVTGKPKWHPTDE